MLGGYETQTSGNSTSASTSSSPSRKHRGAGGLVKKEPAQTNRYLKQANRDSSVIGSVRRMISRVKDDDIADSVLNRMQ